MKRIFKYITLLSIATMMLSLFSGCASLLEEDPDSAQLPWASPAQWENQIPGMPSGGGY